MRLRDRSLVPAVQPGNSLITYASDLRAALPETGERKMLGSELSAELRPVDLFAKSGEKPLPAPAALPSLATAFSRRAALFGAVTVGAASAAPLAALAAPLALGPTDARLVALADAYEALDREVNATRSTAPGYEALIDRYFPIEEELTDTPADTMAGVLAKARVLQIPSCRDCAGADLGGSIADDLVRFHTEGRLS